MRKSSKLILAAAMVCFVFMAVNSNPALADPPEGKGKKDQCNCVQVYDSSEPRQYLGILLGNMSYKPAVEIFNPSSGRRILIHSEVGIICRSPGNDPWFYTTSDCSGNPYTGYDHVMDVVYGRHEDYQPYPHYIIESQPALDSNTTLFYAEWKEEGCVPQGSFYLPYPVVRITEIPETDIPFTLPVTLPLQYEYE
jgi:hypothetical protein